jgi:hypothetical protein
MIRILALLLPAMMPSWRFFAMVAPSPRIEFALLGAADEAARRWQEFRPRPARVPLLAMLGRLVWNPRWNESLFLVTRTERFLEGGSPESLREILARIRSDLRGASGGSGAARRIQLRLVVVRREQGGVVREEVYRSPVHPLEAEAAA